MYLVLEKGIDLDEGPDGELVPSSNEDTTHKAPLLWCQVDTVKDHAHSNAVVDYTHREHVTSNGRRLFVVELVVVKPIAAQERVYACK